MATPISVSHQVDTRSVTMLHLVAEFTNRMPPQRLVRRPPMQQPRRRIVGQNHRDIEITVRTTLPTPDTAEQDHLQRPEMPHDIPQQRRRQPALGGSYDATTGPAFRHAKNLPRSHPSRPARPRHRALVYDIDEVGFRADRHRRLAVNQNVPTPSFRRAKSLPDIGW
jgi:hypothetical protein